MTHKRNICLIYPSKLARGPNFPIALLSLWCVIERMQEEWNFEHRETAIPLLKMWRCLLMLSEYPFFFFFFFENLLWLTGSKNVKTLRIILWIPVPKAGFLPVFLFFFPRFSRCQREPGSLVLRVSAKMFIPLNSWLRMFCLLSPSLIQSVCRESNGLTVRREKGCHGSESRLFAHVQTSRMDEDTDGFSLRWTFLLSRPVCGWRHGNPG